MYSFSLSDGQSWGIHPAEEAREWADGFARLLSLAPSQADPDCMIRFERFPHGGAAGNGGLALPPRGCFGGGWRVGIFPHLEVWRHETLRESVCRLHRTDNPSRVREQMRHALMPLYESTVRRGGLPLHAALVERDGRGVLLVGRSGVGKSTACLRLPRKWTVLGDDLALAVRRLEGGFAVHPLPTWSRVGIGSDGDAWNISRGVDLSAVFFLAQAGVDEAEPAGRAAAAVILAHAAETIFNSVRTTAHAFGTLPLKGEIFTNAAAMASAVPSYSLRLSLTGRFWERIEAILEKGETGQSHFSRAKGLTAHGA